MQDKRLQDMTLEELWELFPIVLSPHNPQWSVWAGEEMRSLSSLLVKYHPIISHIGSTAIPDIQAKPIVDILVEISPDIEWQSITDIFERNGYICMSESETCISLTKDIHLPDIPTRCSMSTFIGLVTMRKSFSGIIF